MKTIPLYIQIKNYLLELIEKNAHVQLYKLPSENQLALKFKASRISAKHALDELVKEGVVYRIQGKGSFSVPSYDPVFNRTVQISKEYPFVSIAILIPGFESHFHREIIKGIRDTLKIESFLPIFFFTDGSIEREKEAIHQARLLQCSGIIILPVDNQLYNPEIVKLTIQNFPIILIDRQFPGLDISFVSSNHLQATYDTVQLFVENNHQEIALITPTTSIATSIIDRTTGYERAIKEFELKSNQFLLPDCFSQRQEALKEFFSKFKHCTAIICEGGETGKLLIEFLLKDERYKQFDVALYDRELTSLMPFLPFSPYIIDQTPLVIGKESAILMSQLLQNSEMKKQIIINDYIITRSR